MPRSLWQSGEEGGGSVNKTLEVGFSGIVGIIWADEAMMMKDK